MRSSSRRRSLSVWALLLLAAFAAAEERQYDAEVKRLIDYTNRSFGDFRSAARSDFKKSKIRFDGVETEVSGYLKDTADAGKRLASRVSSDYAAVPEATDFLKRLKTADLFAQENPGISGARNEWELLIPNAEKLAAAYGIDWTTSPETWQPSRAPDGVLRAETDNLETRARALREAVNDAAKAAGLDKGRRKVLEGQSDTLVAAAGALRKTVRDARPASTALATVNEALRDLGSRLQSDGVADTVSGLFRPVEDSAGKLSGMLEAPPAR
jgi:hypothetical protein